MDSIEINGQKYTGHHIKTSVANILMIQAKSGFLACGYFDIETANKLGEPVAIVTGVKNYDDMLSAKVVKLSKPALDKGLTLGMSGKEALSKLV